MAETTQNPLQVIFNELIDFVAGITGNRKIIFLDRRPDKTEDSMTQFVVITLPAEIKDIVAGSSDFALKTTGILYCYNRAKSNATLNLNSQSQFAYSIKKGFPLNAEHITATKPTLLMEGYDGNGFHVTSLTFRLRTKPNAFK